MNICYLADAKSIHVRRWAGWFALRGHEVHVLSVFEGAIPSVTVHVLSKATRSSLALPSKVREVSRLLDGLSPDVTHAHQTNQFGLWGALAGHRPFVVSAWGSDVLVLPEKKRLEKFALKFVMRRADWCIPVAEHLRVRMIAYGLRADRSEAIPMGVELDRHPVVPYRAGARPPTFVSTRNLHPVYDVATLVRAAKTISHARSDVRGAILGDGPEAPALRRLAGDLGLGDRLRFEGAVGEDRVMSALSGARVYVSTSTSDGASVSLLEAMARGCFPVVTDIPANREWIDSGHNGLLVPVGDAPALATAVLAAMDDEALLEAASRTNLALVAERGDLSKNLERVESRYRLLAEGRAP